ncbi:MULTISPECIES: glutathione S-transferase C-terminal domain-containing protein [Burkholderiaceae]|uniref:glutathione S-transferase C-terminal domain-containing protein n=1 Tax=Burkholderiaceae TaxID=119060 RepID=UPI00095DC3BA|nr:MULTISPECIES: glutathione S-transferase C-terminal domain-containing protein [Burkholderiaceae]MCG1038340.1 glutathione S-transferase N-terminal domain-containing protein [Mycetohabitans sp. B7]SIT78941.1 glutathione S-transferase [Burkholderia sp. b14]
MKLIGSLSSPFVRKVRIVMAEKKIDYKLVLENPWAVDTVIHDFNPLGKVPYLVMEDGEAMFDSRVICEYVDTLTPVGKLLPQLGRERAAVRGWEALTDGVLEAAVLVRVEATQRDEGQRSQAWVERQQRKIHAGLAAMARGLGERPWCHGNHYTLADIALGCTLGYLDFRMSELAWRDAHPNLDKHFTKLSQRQAFVDTLPQA